MTLLSSSSKETQELIKALGLGNVQHIRSLKLTIEPNEAVHIEIIKYITVDEIENLKEVCKKYELHARSL